MLHKFFIRCKDSTNQVKYKVKTKFSTFKSEVSLSCQNTKSCQIIAIERTIPDYKPEAAIRHVMRPMHS